VELLRFTGHLDFVCVCVYGSTGEFALLVHTGRVSTDESFIVFIMRNSKSNHLGAHGTFKGALQLLSRLRLTR